MSRFLPTSVCALTIILAGCSSLESQSPTAPSETICPEPRPQICTMDYTPVCGLSNSGDKRTYSNGCAACGDDEIRAYQPDRCPTL